MCRRVLALPDEGAIVRQGDAEAPVVPQGLRLHGVIEEGGVLSELQRVERVEASACVGGVKGELFGPVFVREVRD